MPSPSIETEFGIYCEDFQAWPLPGAAALLAMQCKVSFSVVEVESMPKTSALASCL